MTNKPAGGARWAFFARELRRAFVCIYSQRPTMGPGSKVFDQDKPLNSTGGMQDYLALVYRPPHQHSSEIIWLQPD